MTDEEFQKLKRETWERAGIAEGQFYFVKNGRGEVIHFGVFEEDAKVPRITVRETTVVTSVLLNSSRTVVEVGHAAVGAGDTLQINLSVNS